ncbi:MAG: trypsin-like peptidase domain-containing protein [Pseudomonadota bacterium]
MWRNRSFWIASMFAPALVCSSLANARAGDLSKFRKIQESVVELINRGSNHTDTETLCAAVFIGEQEILTAKHCLNRDGTHIIRTAQGRQYPVIGVVRGSGPNDLASLRVDVPANLFRPLRLSAMPPQHGQILTRVSPTTFGSDAISQGALISFFGDPLNAGTNYQVRISVTEGMSGSPVVDEKGEIVGIVLNQWPFFSKLEISELPRTDIGVVEHFRDQREIAPPLSVSVWWEQTWKSIEGKYLELLGVIMERNSCERVETRIQKLTEGAGDFAEPWVLLAFCQAKAGRTDDAIRSFEKSTTLKENPLLLTELAYLYFSREGGRSQSDRNMAIRYLNQAIDLSPDDKAIQSLRENYR